MKAGTGTLILSAANAFTGDTTISAGTLQLGNGGTTGTLASTNIINNGTLAFNYNADTTVTNNISGTGAVQVIGASGTLFSGFLTTAAQTIATNTTVAEVLYRITGGRENGGAISSAGVSGAYVKSFDPQTNTATFQVQQYETNGGFSYTKTVFVKLTQSGTSVQAAIDTGAGHTSGAAYSNNGTNVLGTDMSTGYNSMGLSTAVGSGGYGVDALYTTAKVKLTGSNSYNGGTLLVNTTNTVSAGGNQYSQTALGTLQIEGAGNFAGGNITNNGVLIFNGSAAQSMSGAMSGSGYFIKNASNTLTLSGANTFAGTTLLNAGTLKAGIASVGSVGAVTSSAFGTVGLTVPTGTSIDLNGYTLPIPLNIGGTGIASGGALFNSSASAAGWTGPITLSANSTFISTPGITLGTVNGGAYSLAVTAGTGAGTGDITLNGPVTFSGENISTFTASRNININAPINVNGTTAGSGIALVYNKAAGTGDYNFGLSSTGSGVGMTASFAGAINFASTASTFTTQNNVAAVKSFTLVDAFTTAAPSTSTFYCLTTTQCGANTANFALTRNINATGFSAANMRALGTTNATYTGTFTGLGHSITGLSLSGSSNVGLFQSTGNGAAVRDLRLSATTISGGTNTGALVASASNSLSMSNVVMDAVTGANAISSTTIWVH
jgi:autotransporter-associated beta strand protein